MTLDEKLDIFYNSAIKSATEQSDQIIEEYKESLKKIEEEHKAEIQRKAHNTLQIESDHLVREKNKQLSTMALDIRRNITEKIDELKEDLFDDVEKKLADFMKTPDYTALLTKQIKEAMNFAKGNQITIYINPSDKKKKEALEKTTGAVLTISTIDFMGGIRAVIHDKNILIDHSFQNSLTEQKEIFSLNTVSTLPNGAHI